MNKMDINPDIPIKNMPDQPGAELADKGQIIQTVIDNDRG